MTSVEFQQLQLLHQVQNHTMPLSHAFLLGWLLKFPLPLSIFPLQARLNLYYMLSSPNFPILSALSSNNLLFSFIIIAWPLWFMILMATIYFLVKSLKPFLLTVFPLVFAKAIKKEPLAFLELQFPSGTSKSAYATEQLYALLHTLAKRKSGFENWMNTKKQYSLEIVSTRKEGIRYLLAAPQKEAEILQRSLLSYLPGIKIKEIDDYLNSEENSQNVRTVISDLKLSSHFALPLNRQKVLSEHDPISYLTGHMASLDNNGLIAFQVVVTPVLNSIHTYHAKEMHNLRLAMYNQKPITPILQKGIIDKLATIPVISIFVFALKVIWKIFSFALMFVYSMFLGFIDPNSKTIPFLMTTEAIKNAVPTEILNPYEQELRKVVREKIDQQLFETSIRILVAGKNSEDVETRIEGILSSFGMMSSPYQMITPKSSFGLSPFKKRFADFERRKLSQSTGLNENPVLSASELSDIYHFPYTDTTKTEDLIKVRSVDLPAPLSLKQGKPLDVVFGKNTFGGKEVEIGLTEEDRSRHIFILGRTGTGKSTIVFHMANCDIQKGRGVAVIDPHGDLAEDLLSCIPEERINNCCYFNPFDIGYPVGINLLELTPTSSEDELEQEKELVCEGVVSLFRREFAKEEKTDAHRIEYILRNMIYTAFTVKDATIFTIYDLLNNPDFRRNVVSELEDDNLKNFWKNEFGHAGNWQIVKMVGGVTAKVGRFLFSPSAKRILEQPKSTINFDGVLDSGKILICNLAEGKLGEDTSRLLGTMIITKIQQAAMRRVRSKLSERKPFYLFVDEFQNFASSSFMKLLSGGRKFGLSLTIAEQSTAQQADSNDVNVTLANIGTMICFQTASPIDEELMLNQFAPTVSKGDIINLPRYKFYIKLSSLTPEDPFSGETFPIPFVRDEEKMRRVIEASRKNYAIKYVRPAKTTKKKGDAENDVKEEIKDKKPVQKMGLPSLKKRK